ncbi:MAG: recombinase XerC [Clostridium sp. 26_22]|jgi:integrase/recombinase XerD|nr:MAG: recombinase XerC [Clostridium sp. 26_22]
MINHENNPDYLNSFLDYTVTILNKSPNTIKEYNYDLATFLKFIKVHFKMTDEEDFSKITIKDIPLSTIKQIKLDDIHAFLSYLTNTYHSKAATRARKASSIRVFFNYLSQKANLIEFNPAQNLETPKLDKRLPKYLSLEDSKRLLNVAGSDDNRNNKRDYAIITLFLNCGMRLSELVGINIKDINFSECQMTVIGKGNKERTIYLNKACMTAINNYLAVRPVEGIKTDKANSKNALFLSERKERISRRTVQYIVDKELRVAGLDTSKYSVHKLRHTAATLMYQYGNVDIRALQEVLGHESISTTEIYTHVANVQARSAIENNPLSDVTQD